MAAFAETAPLPARLVAVGAIAAIAVLHGSGAAGSLERDGSAGDLRSCWRWR